MNKMRISTKRTYKKDQILELNNTMTIEKFTRWVHSRFDQAEERNCKLKNESFEIIKSEEQKEWRTVYETYGNHSITLICVLWVSPKRRDRKEQRTYLKK